eukprot:s5893_g6.t1
MTRYYNIASVHHERKQMRTGLNLPFCWVVDACVGSRGLSVEQGSLSFDILLRRLCPAPLCLLQDSRTLGHECYGSLADLHTISFWKTD